MKETLAIVAAVMAALATVPYLVDIVRGKTKPNIVSWFTWTLLTAISGSAALSAGEKNTAMLLFASSFCTGLVVVLGLKYGIAKFSAFDILCQVGAIMGLILWLVFSSPTIGIVVPLAIDFVGMLPTLRHAWLKPGEETWQTFAISAVAPLLTILSLSRFNTASLAFPLYLLLANTAITFAILTQRKRHAAYAGSNGSAI